MELKPVNKIDSDANTIRVSDGNSPIRLIFKDAKGEVINLYDKIDYFYLTKDDETFFSVTDISYEGDEVIFRLPKLRKGQYKAEIRDKDGSIYPANEDLYILLRRSFEDDKDIYYFGHREDILNNVEPIIIQHIEENPDKFRGERGQQGFPGRDGLPGIDGKDGKDGIDGEKGDPGKDGSMSFVDLTPEEKEELRGERGRPGLDGKDGIDGKDGLPGKDGRDGIDGNDGINGKDGKDGLPGEDGKDGVGIDPINDIRTYYNDSGSYTEALKEALKVTNHIIFPSGTFNIGTGFEIPSGVTIEGQGNSTILNTISGNIPSFELKGSISDEINITRNIVNFTDEISLSDVSTLKIGDYIVIKSSQDCMSRVDNEEWFLGAKTNQDQVLPFGEFKKIIDIYDSKIKVDSPLIFPTYNTNNTGLSSPAKERSKVAKVDFVENVTFKNFRINRNRSGRLFNLNYTNNILIDGVYFDNVGFTGGSNESTFVTMSNSLNNKITNSTYYLNEGIRTNNYYNLNVFKIVSCQNCGLDKITSYNASQAVDITFNNNSIPNINCYVINSDFINSYTCGITSHGGNFMTRISGNNISGSSQGINHRGRKSVIINNTIIGYKVSNQQQFGIGLYQGATVETVISNNNIANFFIGIGCIDGGTVPEGRMRYMGVSISNNTIKNCDSSIQIYRFPSGVTGVRAYDYMDISIIDNIINMCGGLNNSPIEAIWIRDYGKGIKIINNKIKGIYSESTGLGNPRTNNYRGIKIDSNVTDVKMFFNSFVDIDYDIDSPSNETIISDFNDKVRVRISSKYN